MHALQSLKLLRSFLQETSRSYFRETSSKSRREYNPPERDYIGTKIVYFTYKT